MSGPRRRMLWNEERYFPNEWLHSLSISTSICLYLWFPAQAVSLAASLGPGRPLMIIISIIRVDSRGACVGQMQSRARAGPLGWSCWSRAEGMPVFRTDTHTHTHTRIFIYIYENSNNIYRYIGLHIKKL